MNLALLTGGVLAVLLGVIHSVLGERLILGPLFARSELPRLLGSETFARRTLRFAWHLTTVLLAGLGGLVMALAQGPLEAQGVLVLKVVAVTFALCGGVSLLGARGRHFSWYVFLVIAALVAWGAARG